MNGRADPPVRIAQLAACLAAALAIALYLYDALSRIGHPFELELRRSASGL